jgi:hypothetical protein
MPGFLPPPIPGAGSRPSMACQAYSHITSRGGGAGSGGGQAGCGSSQSTQTKLRESGGCSPLPCLLPCIWVRPFFSLPFSTTLSQAGRGMGSNGLASLDKRWTRRRGKEINGESEDILACDLDKIRETRFPFRVLSTITKRCSFSQYVEISFCCKNDQN